MRINAVTRLARAFVAAAGGIAAGASCSATGRLSMNDGQGRIAHVEINQEGFQPSAIDVRRGVPLTIELVRTTDATCATKVVFPEQRIERELPLGAPVRVEIATDRARAITFQCGMGMYRGSVVVR